MKGLSIISVGHMNKISRFSTAYLTLSFGLGAITKTAVLEGIPGLVLKNPTLPRLKIGSPPSKACLPVL